MPEMYDFLSSIVMSPEFRKKFKDLLKGPNPRQAINNLAMQAGYTLTKDELDKILNLQIEDPLEKEFQDVNDFIKGKTGLDPQW